MVKKGYNQTEGHKRKLKESHLGKYHSEETKRKISVSNIGKHYCSEAIIKKRSEILKKIMSNPEIRRRISEGRTGLKLSEETKNKISKIHKGKHHSEEHKKLIGLAHKGKKQPWVKNNPQVFQKGQSPWNKGKKGLQVSWNKGLTKEIDIRLRTTSEKNKTQIRWLKGLTKDTDERIKEHSKIMKLKWQNSEYKEKVLKSLFNSLKLKPNNPEKIIINLIKENNLPFNYVGNGQIIIGGYNPDFISKNPKHIIEVFGDYWHNLPGAIEKDKKKLTTYLGYGYKTLIIWEHELKDLNQVLKKIEEFIK